MKSAVLVSSMAMLASAGTAFPKSKDMSEIRKSLKTERAKVKVAAKVNGAKAGTMAAESLLKEEGISVADVKSMDHDEIFFEMRKGLSDCDSTVKMVAGFEVNRCINAIWNDGEVGRPESEVIIKPKNGGFPIFLWFDGHGCNEDRLYGWMRLPKTGLGYAPDYVTGDCDPMMAGDGTTVLFHQGAGWKSERYEPMDDAIMGGFDGSERGCQRNKYQGYSIQSADFCGVAEEDDMTGMPYSWSKFDVSNCDSGSVDEVFYSDPNCSSMMYSETRYPETCVFDNMQFQDQIMYDDWGYLEFTSRACHKMSSTI